MSWNNFDSSMQNEGGGFMDTTVSGDGAGGDDKGPKRGQNCIPVVIEQILRHGEELTVWGTQVKIITFVAKVNKVEASSTKVTFEFKDETGILKGLKWLEGDSTDYVPPVKTRTYARVHGLIRDQAGEPYVLVISVQPIPHLNELLVHLAEVTLATLQGEIGLRAPMNNTLKTTESSNDSNLHPHQQMVLDIIQNGDPEYGAERQTIKKQVPPNVAPKVDEILDFLSSEGHIYTTKTDDFFKAI